MAKSTIGHKEAPGRRIGLLGSTLHLRTMIQRRMHNISRASARNNALKRGRTTHRTLPHLIITTKAL